MNHYGTCKKLQGYDWIHPAEQRFAAIKEAIERPHGNASPFGQFNHGRPAVATYESASHSVKAVAVKKQGE